MSDYIKGVKVKFVGKKQGDTIPDYDSGGNHIIHGMTRLGESYEDEGAVVVCRYRSFVAVKYTDTNDKLVCLNFREEYLELFTRKDELKNNKMDINEVKNLDKDVLKKAKANVLKARKEMQTEQAEAVLTELFDIKDAIEEKIGENQEALNSVTEDIKVFDVK